MNKPNKPAQAAFQESMSSKNEGPRGSLWSRSMPLKGLEQFCQRLGIGLRSGVDIMKLLKSSARWGTRRLVKGGTIDRWDSCRPIVGRGDGGAAGILSAHVGADGFRRRSRGGLDRVFLHMAEYYKDLRDARGDFLQRISWPLIQLGLAILIVSGVIVLQEFLSPSTPAQMISNTMPQGSGCEACRGYSISGLS